MRISLSDCVLVAAIALLMSACSSPSSSSGNLGATSTPSSNGSDKVTTSTPGSKSTPSNPQEPLIYPNASQVSTTRNAVPPWTQVTFEADDPYGKVYKYYKETLTGQGWLLTRESADHEMMDFVWKPTAEGSVVNVDLSLVIGPAEGGKTQVFLMNRPWPNPNRVPLYPDAHQVKAEYSPYSVYGKLVTTYSTAATPDAIQAFYESTLPALGWEFAEENGNDITAGDGIRFGYVRGDSSMEDKNGSVYIVAEVGTAGETHVKLTALGRDVQPLATPQK